MFDEEEWTRLMDHAWSERRPWRHMIITPTDEFIDTECALLGIDVTGHILRIDSSRLRHVVNRHGVGWVEGDLGQLPIRNAHLREIPTVLCKPHTIERAPKFNPTKPALLFKRTYYDHGNYQGATVACVVASVRSTLNPKRLFFETMYWKRPG